MKHLSITIKLVILVAMIAAIIGGLTYYEIKEFRHLKYEDRYTLLQTHVESAVSVLEHYQGLEASGEMTQDEAQRAAYEAISAMRYEPNGYVFVISFEGVFTVHPSASLLGTNQWKLTDKAGRPFLQEMVELARNGGGIYTYQWNKPGQPEEALFDKASYTAAFQPWGLAIGTGAYVDDVEALVAREISRSIKVGGGAIALLLLAAMLFSRSITRPLAQVRTALDAVARDDVEIAVPHTRLRNEIGLMAKSTDALQGKVRERIALEQQQAESQRALDAERQANLDLQQRENERQARVVETIKAALEALAGGDLSIRCDDLGDRDAELRRYFNEALGKLDDAMSEITSKGGDIGISKDEIRRASLELSQRTERQAASLEETSAALEELSSSVQLTAEGARDAAKRVVSVAQETETSDAIVNDAINAMSGIEKSSAQISNIIGVIEDIAFQTNLLALNAGVEAARAGESGKGFAVVAQEVRELAQRSSAAAKDVKDQIVESSSQVENGVKLVGDTSEALKRIFTQIKAARDTVTSIADSASEQDTTLRSLTSSINEMDASTQQNAAMAEETTACTEALAADSEHLIALINRFRVTGGGSAGSEMPFRMAG